MIPEARVLLVDNQESELRQLSDAMMSAGIPFTACLYDAAEGITPAIKPSSSIRIIFVDLNLDDSPTPTAERIAGHVSRVIKFAIATGPFIVVFWTKHEELAADVVALLNSRYPELPQPISHSTIEKSKFHVLDAHSGDPESKSKVRAELIDVIIGKLDLEPSISSITTWETRVSLAASQTAAFLFNTLPKSGNYNAKENFGRLFALMARSAVGRDHIGAEVELALEKALLPLLEDALSNLSADADYRKRVIDAMGDPTTATPAAPFTASGINAALLLDRNPTGIKKTDRGAWIPLDAVPDADIQTLFGLTKDQLLLAAFIKPAPAGTDPNQHLTELRAALPSGATLGLVEISAACDHSQAKRRLYKYELSLFAKCSFLKAYARDWDKTKNECKQNTNLKELWVSPKISHAWAGPAPEESQLLANAMYVLGLPESSTALRTVSFRLKKPLITQVAEHYARHHSRQGIMTVST